MKLLVPGVRGGVLRDGAKIGTHVTGKNSGVKTLQLGK